MEGKISVIEIEGDECLPAEMISEKINAALEKHNVSALDVVSIMQPSGYTVTRVFYRRREVRKNLPPA